MRGAINFEKLNNAISIAKQALLFYANEDNYNPKLGSSANILIDCGHQAKYALDIIENVIEPVEPNYTELAAKELMEIKQEALKESVKELKNETKFFVKLEYERMLDSGMLFEQYPKLTGNWEEDEEKFTKILMKKK